MLDKNIMNTVNITKECLSQLVVCYSWQWMGVSRPIFERPSIYYPFQ